MLQGNQEANLLERMWVSIIRPFSTKQLVRVLLCLPYCWVSFKLRGDCDARRHSQSPIFNIHEWGDFVNTFLAIPQTITDDCLTSGIFLLCKIEMLVRRNIEVRVLAIVMYVTNHRWGVKGTALVHSYDNKEFNYKKGVALVPHSID